MIVVTGADGFIGARACELLEGRGHEVRRVVRRFEGPGRDRRVVPDLTSEVDWQPILRGADAILHLAARAHVVRERDEDPEAAFHRSNVQVTRRLAEQATAAGVRRFVFVSSIGVNGPQTIRGPFVETDTPLPSEPYARSKLECEQILRSIASASALEVVIVRPPLIYGPHAKGNLLRMLKLVACGVPLPLASVQNRRNIVGLDNLCDALALCVESPNAAGEMFLVAEQEARSTSEIFAALYTGMGRRSRLFGCPPALLRSAARLVGAGLMYDKLCSSLEVDPGKIMRVLGWQPSRSFADEMTKTARWYLGLDP